jgi:hypothetical protein
MRKSLIGAVASSGYRHCARPTSKIETACGDWSGPDIHDRRRGSGHQVDGVAAFAELHGRRHLAEAMLYAFDLLEHNGEDLRPLPFSQRKSRLARLLARARGGLALAEHI